MLCTIHWRIFEMKIVSASFMALLVLSMTTSSALLNNPQDPVNEVFAQTSGGINDLANYVVLGFEEVELKKDVVITNGNVGVNDDDSEVKLDTGTVFNDPNSALVGDSVKIEKNTIVQNVYYNELENKGKILVTENTPLAFPVIDNFPSIPDFPPGTTSINVDKDDTLTLSPGQYDEIFVDEKGTLIFEGGLYSATKIESKKEANLLFDSSSELVIQDEFKLDKESTLGPSQTSTISASNIIIYVENGNVSFDKDVVIDTNIFAPNGEIKMDKGAQATGAFVANKVKIDKDSTLTLDSSIRIFALIDELEEILAEIDALFLLIEQDPDAEIFETANKKIEKLRSIIAELESSGVTVEVEAVESSPLKLIIRLLGKGLPISGKILEILSTVCGIASVLGTSEYYVDVLGIPDLANSEKNALAIVNRDLCFDAPITAFTSNPESIPQVARFLENIGEFIIGKGSPFNVVNVLNQPFIRTEWLQIATGGFFGLLDLDLLVESVIANISAMIMGVVFDDKNGNQIQDGTEGTLSDWEITLTDLETNLILDITTTDVNGQYLFSTAHTAFTKVEAEIRPETEQTLPDPGGPTGGTYHVNITSKSFPGETTILDFGNRQNTAVLTVIKNVINNDGGALNPSNFMIHVSGNNPTPATFAGSGGSAGILFQDDYSTNVGWIQVGGTVTVDSPSFPDRVHFANTFGGCCFNDQRVYKQLAAPLPLNGWVLEFDYIYTSSQLAGHMPLTLTETTDPSQIAGATDHVILFHGLSQNNLRLWTSGGSQNDGDGIDIVANTIHYIRLERTPTNLELSIFSDPARTIHIAGSPVSISIAESDFDSLNYIQHSNSYLAGPARILTGDVDNTVISSMGTGGTLVEIGPGAYSVTEDPVTGYTGSFSADCSGTISSGESKTCIITNDDTSGINTETIIPTDATYTNGGTNTNTNHNDVGNLVVESATFYNGHDTRKIWLKFELPTISVISATLSLYATGGETLPTPTEVYYHNDNNWSEDTITYDNEPAHFAGLTSGPHATNTVSSVNQYYDFDVTDLINTAGSTTVTMVFVNTLIETNNGIIFTDETTSTPPLLVIEYQ
jgi:hypothetical protein